MCKISYWDVPALDENSGANCYRNNYVNMLKEMTVEQICKNYTEISESSLEDLLSFARQHVCSTPLEGVGIDLGGGVALLSSVVAKSPKVLKIYCIELAQHLVQEISPRVIKHTLGVNSSKVQLVVGSFDHLNLGDNSIDFAIEIGSLHHSNDLNTSFKEILRVLKPGGLLLCFDRVQPNSLSDYEVNKMLSSYYSKAFLTSYGLPPDSVITRRENGEHEYRLREWESAYSAAGFSLDKMITIHRAIYFRDAVKGMLSILPSRITKFLFRTPKTIETTRRYLKQLFSPNYHTSKRLRIITAFALSKSSFPNKTPER